MIKISKLGKTYSEDNTVISLRDFEFEEGKSYCILGPSGCGKSTLLNMIAGLTKPTNGEVEINTKEGKVNLISLSQSNLDKFRSSNIGYMSQNFSLIDSFTVKDNLDIASEVGVVINNIPTVASWVGLENKLKSKVKNLSGGERQRVSIARSLIKNPPIMLCDEPTASLNTKLAHKIIELIVELHKKNNNTLIVVTHDQGLTDYFDHVVKFEDLLN